MSKRRKLVAVIGDGRVPSGDPREVLAARVGELIIDSGWRLVTGGRGGVMEAACLGARRSSAYREGDVVGILPGTDPDEGNPFVDIVMTTGLGHARNILVAQSDAVVAIGGGAGTLAEIAFAWLLRRMIVALRVPGWSGKVADSPLDDKIRFPNMPDDRVFGADTAEDVVATIRSKIDDYEAQRGAALLRAKSPSAP